MDSIDLSIAIFQFSFFFIQDLVNDDSLEAGTIRNSATMNFLSKGTKPAYEKLWDKIRNNRGLVVDSDEGRQRVKKGGLVHYHF